MKQLFSRIEAPGRSLVVCERSTTGANEHS
jgi:hypothetical protein